MVKLKIIIKVAKKLYKNAKNCNNSEIFLTRTLPLRHICRNWFSGVDGKLPNEPWD